MDRDFLIDLFGPFGPVTIRRMFSGFGISADGTNFALALRSGLYFRADDQMIPQFEIEGSKPFQYQTRSKMVTVNSYWELPARLFDDPEEFSGWAKAALGAAQRAAIGKRPRMRKSAKAAAEKAAADKAAADKAAANKPGASKAAAKRRVPKKTAASKAVAKKLAAKPKNQRKKSSP
jgi:DNA transformation protein